MKVPLSDVPMRYRRTAMRHLDALRKADMGGSEPTDAELDDQAWPIFRPDLDDVAYWELQLRPANEKDQGGARRREPAPGASADAPRGFVVVATGDHDFPVSHWSVERPPVSYQLEQEASKTGKQVARIYRLDALAYLAEDTDGNEIARTGQSPALPEGLPLSTSGLELSSMVVQPKSKGDDSKADQLEFAVERKGPKDPDIKLVDPKEWRNLKKEYKGRFEPFLDEVRRRAGHAWRIDRQVEEFGEGLIAGDEFDVRLLEREAKVEVTGKGKQDVTVEVDDKRPGKPLAHAKTTKRKHKEELDFELQVSYGSGESETLRYFIVSADTPSKAKGAGNRPGRPS